MTDFTPWPPEEHHIVEYDNIAATGQQSREPAFPEDAPTNASNPLPISDDPHPPVFIDSSAIVALVDRDDASHEAAVAAYHQLLESECRLFTTNYVIAETYDLLCTGVGHVVARLWLRDCSIAVYHADEQDERRARRVVLRGKGATGLTLTDAISLVVMERLNVTDAFAVDPNFLADVG
jgi:predicted nucleic acid-binding protein